jgi:beta-lactamase superfamily II metal-dependent hydrolase
MFEEPKVIFWPVGTGDSTSIVVQDGIVLQVDLRDLHAADDADDDHVALVDELAENLPKVDGKPYLSAFALTHPDQDHILGFEELLDRVTIGEIWFTPRVFIENDQDLCDDAAAFKEEAERRVQATIQAGGDVGSGDRVRLIGYDALLKRGEFAGFPEDRLTIPGNSITEIDGDDYEGEFNAFIHAPFAEETAGDRNNTSLCMQVVLGDDPSQGGVLLFGDIAYPRIRRIFDTTKKAGNEDYLKWKVFLAPHHCSKSAMYQTENGSEVLKQDMLDDLADFQVEGGVIVASSEEIPSQNESGDNPPHAKAKKRYEEVADGGFLCTHEDGESGEPLIFQAEDGTLTAPDVAEAVTASATSKLASAVDEARGSDSPPSEQVGYGS